MEDLETKAVKTKKKEEEVLVAKVPDLLLTKTYYSIGEVSEMFGLNPSVLRFWEDQFKQISPKTNKKGDRRYQKEDIELIARIFELTKVKGYTLAGAKKVLANNTIEKKAEAVKRLEELKDLLSEIHKLIPDQVEA